MDERIAWRGLEELKPKLINPNVHYIKASKGQARLVRLDLDGLDLGDLLDDEEQQLLQSEENEEEIRQRVVDATLTLLQKKLALHVEDKRTAFTIRLCGNGGSYLSCSTIYGVRLEGRDDEESDAHGDAHEARDTPNAAPDPAQAEKMAMQQAWEQFGNSLAFTLAQSRSQQLFEREKQLFLQESNERLQKQTFDTMARTERHYTALLGQKDAQIEALDQEARRLRNRLSEMVDKNQELATKTIEERAALAEMASILQNDSKSSQAASDLLKTTIQSASSTLGLWLAAQTALPPALRKIATFIAGDPELVTALNDPLLLEALDDPSGGGLHAFKAMLLEIISGIKEVHEQRKQAAASPAASPTSEENPHA